MKDPDTPTQHVSKQENVKAVLGMCVWIVTVEEQRDAAAGECDLMDFSKDHSDPCWTGQTSGL